jgi:cobalt transporter subunit CbtB
MTTAPDSRPIVLTPARTLVPAVLAMVLGGFIIAAVGFAGSEVLHNAAHDSRHSFAFPCH